MTPEVELLIVAADPLARTGLATLLDEQAGLKIVGQVSGQELLTALDLYQPDVVLVDLGWEGDALLELLQEQNWEGEDVALVALLPDEEAAGYLWGAGVRGLLDRQVSAEQLVVALTAVNQGLTVIDPAWQRSLFPTSPTELPQSVEKLTPREMEVLQRLAEGFSNRAIGQQLGISDHTVKFHVTAIMSKLNARSRTAAVVQATRLGLLSL